MEKANLSRISTQNFTQDYLFYKYPKALDDEFFSDLTDKAVRLFILMLNRVSLSLANPGFRDKNGDVFIIYTIEQIMESVRCCNKTAVKILKQLENKGLIEKKRRGQGLASLIYVMDIGAFKIEKYNASNFKSRPSSLLELDKVQARNINGIQNNLREKEISIYPEKLQKMENKTNKESDNDMIDNNICETVINQPKDDNISMREKIEENIKEPEVATPEEKANTEETEELNNILNSDNITQTVAENICLDELLEKYPENKKEVEMLYENTCEILANKNPRATVRISRQNVPVSQVKKVFAKLKKEHIEYIISCLEKNDNKLKIKGNTKSYFMTSLFNAPRTIGYYYSVAFKKPEKTKSGGHDCDKLWEQVVRKTMKF